MANQINVQPEDILSGLDAVISVYVNEPKFGTQSKVKLGGKEVEDAIYAALVKELNKFVSNMSSDQKTAISKKIIDNAKVRQAADIAKMTKRKSISGKSPANLPSKLKDCSMAGDDIAELYICEGDSACGSIVAARDSRFQAVLPIRGKILNVLKMDLTNKKQRERFDANAEINDITKAIGAGMGEHFDISKCRYGKVMFAADSDVDGLDIDTLLLGLFYRLYRPMIEAGMVYQCVSPFYEIKYMSKTKSSGKAAECVEYAVSESERMDIEKRLKSKNISYNLARAKGLGELNADVFHDITLNPNNRTLVRISIGDAEKADKMLNLAIGDMSADDRKSWMLDNTNVIDELGLYQ